MVAFVASEVVAASCASRRPRRRARARGGAGGFGGGSVCHQRARGRCGTACQRAPRRASRAHRHHPDTTTVLLPPPRVGQADARARSPPSHSASHERWRRGCRRCGARSQATDPPWVPRLEREALTATTVRSSRQRRGTPRTFLRGAVPAHARRGPRGRRQGTRTAARPAIDLCVRHVSVLIASPSADCGAASCAPGAAEPSMFPR